MENLFMGIVSLYFLIKGIWFILIKIDQLENYIDEFDWITGPKDER